MWWWEGVWRVGVELKVTRSVRLLFPEYNVRRKVFTETSHLSENKRDNAHHAAHPYQ